MAPSDFIRTISVGASSKLSPRRGKIVMLGDPNLGAIGATRIGMAALTSSPAAVSRSDAAREMPRAAAPAYDAFISYSHAKDKPIAAALQRVVQKLGKPWYRRRALRLFRDDTSLTATPHLWPSIEQALGQSRFLILLASPEAAASPWVDKELAWWLDQNSADTVLIALTDGELSWDGVAGDFRRSPIPALPPTLKGRFANEPRWIDLRPYRSGKIVRGAEFDDLAADFAAAIRGTPKEDLLSQEVREQRRALLLARSAVATLIVLLAIAFIFLGIAGWQWRQAKIGQVDAVSASSKAIFLSNNQLKGMKTGISAAKTLSKSWWQAWWPDRDLKHRVNGTMQELLRGATEHNRLSVGARVMGIAFAPDDKTIATLTERGKLQLWKADGTPWLEKSGVSAVAFGRDGKIALALPREKMVAVGSLDNGESWKGLSVDKSQIIAIAFSADGKNIVAAMADKTTDGKNVGRVELWNLDNGSSRILDDHDIGVPMAVAVSPDGAQIAVAAWNGAFLWRTDGREEPKKLEGDGRSVNAVAFSPDGTMIATGGNDKMVRLWKSDGTRATKVPLSGHADAIWGLSFRPDGKVVASASNDRTVKLWQIDGTLLSTLAGHRDAVRAVPFSHDGKMLASASDDGTVRLWALGGAPALKALKHDDGVYAAAFSPNGRIILTTSGHGWFTLWSPDGTFLQTLQPQFGPITAVAFSRDGKMAATAGSDRTVELWTIDDRGKLSSKGRLEGQTGETDQNAVLALSFSPDGKSIVAGGVGGDVQVWNTDHPGSKPKPLLTTKGAVIGVDFSPDGKNVVVSDGSGTVVVVNSESGARVHPLPARESGSSPAYGVRYSPNGKTIAAYTDHAVKRWTADGKPLRPLLDRDSPVVGFGFSPVGRTLASASQDGSVKIWSEDGTLIKTLPGHEGTGQDIAVSRVAFSPDGKTVASANEGRTVVLWNWQEDLSLDGTLAHACQWIHDYLTNKSKVIKDDRHLCDGIARL
jgi:WD40 repeat protein